MSKISNNQILSPEQVSKIRRETSPVVSQATALVIESPETENQACSILKKISLRLKDIENLRLSITKPLNESLRQANALFKTLAEPLHVADKTIREKILAFRTEQEEAAEKRKQMQEKIQTTRKEKGLEAAAMVEPVAETGETQTQKRWTYELIDISKVPPEYLTLDAGTVRRAINAGIRDISGLRIFQQENVRII